jgi:hypothetical protein
MSHACIPGLLVRSKLIHSVIFVVDSAAVVHILCAGVFNRRSRWTRLALVAAVGESVVFVANRGRCPLTMLVDAWAPRTAACPTSSCHAGSPIASRSCADHPS